MLRLPHTLFMAPMAEITTPALRDTIRDFSSRVILYSEMISAAALVGGSGLNPSIDRKNTRDDPFVYQLEGADPDKMAEACGILSARSCLAVDINMGCSAPDIVKKGAGAKLLTNIALAKRIVRACRKAVPGLLSVKMRTGYEHNDKAYILSFVKMLEEEGIDFIAVHPRYAKLAFKRTADWRLVKTIKENCSFPVIGNGDINSAEHAIRRMNDAGCDGIMIGRTAVKEPWIFRICDALFDNEDITITLDIPNICTTTLDRIASSLPELLHASRGHRFCFYYLKNAEFGHQLLSKIRKVKKIDEMKEIVENYYYRNPHERYKKIEVRNGNVYETYQVQV